MAKNDPWTPERRARQAATLAATRAKKAAALPKDESVAELVSTAHVDPKDVKALLAALDKSREEIADLKAKMSEQTQAALAQAESQQSISQHVANEIPTGRTRKVRQFVEYENRGYKDNGDEIVRPKFKQVEVPTYFYKIDMAPCGAGKLGAKLVINGEEYWDGAVYEFDKDVLATVKDLVYRTWKHEQDIHGRDENQFRKSAEWQARNSRVMRAA